MILKVLSNLGDSVILSNANKSQGTLVPWFGFGDTNKYFICVGFEKMLHEVGKKNKLINK